MIPQFQRIVDPKDGDCLQACVASIIEMPLADMPDFKESEGRDGYYELMCGWLRCRGWVYFQVLDMESWNRIFGLDGLYAIASVPSKNFKDCLHAVVVQFGWHPENGGRTFEIIHDPNPGNDPYDIKDEDIIRWHFMFKV